MEEKLAEIDPLELIIESLDRSLQDYVNNINLCNEQFSEKAVHDFRVSIRRFLACISFVSNTLGQDAVANLKNRLKTQIKAFNPLRDLQVQLIAVQRLVYSYPVLYRLYHMLLEEEEHMLYQMTKILDGFDLLSIDRDMLTIKAQVSKYFVTENILTNHLTGIVYQKLLAVKIAFSNANKNDLKSIHKIRLAFKKFRYMMEISQPITGITDEELLELKGFQSILGSIQDNNIFVNKLKEFQSTQNQVSTEMFTPVLEKLMYDRQNLIDELFESPDRIGNYWKNEYLK